MAKLTKEQVTWAREEWTGSGWTVDDLLDTIDALESDLNLAVTLALEKAASEVDFFLGNPNGRAIKQNVLALRSVEGVKMLADFKKRVAAEARAEEIERCAVEAGERSPEGVSSHTMLGDMWENRIIALRAAAEASTPKVPAISGPQPEDFTDLTGDPKVSHGGNDGKR